jgi:hypothetical protein
MRSRRSSGDPWLALNRATDIPAAASDLILSRSEDAGPSVQTILARRLI